MKKNSPKCRRTFLFALVGATLAFGINSYTTYAADVNSDTYIVYESDVTGTTEIISLSKSSLAITSNLQSEAIVIEENLDEELTEEVEIFVAEEEDLSEVEPGYDLRDEQLELKVDDRDLVVETQIAVEAELAEKQRLAEEEAARLAAEEEARQAEAARKAAEAEAARKAQAVAQATEAASVAQANLSETATPESEEAARLAAEAEAARIAAEAEAARIAAEEEAARQAAAAAAAATSNLPTLENTPVGDRGALVIDSIGLKLPLYYANEGNSQAVTDAANSAAWITYWAGYPLVADHNTQGFSRLSSVGAGTTAYILNTDGSVTTYVASEAHTAYSADGIDFTLDDGRSMRYSFSSGFVTYTCHPAWPNIYMVHWTQQ